MKKFSRVMRGSTPFVAVAALLAIAVLSAKAQTYSLTVLPPFSATDQAEYTSEGFAISQNGKVTGSSRYTKTLPWNGQVAGWYIGGFLWTPTGSNATSTSTMVKLGALDSGWAAFNNSCASIGRGVNNNGEVFGTSGTNQGGTEPRPFKWADGVMTGVTAMPADPYRRGGGLGLNENGVGVGYFDYVRNDGSNSYGFSCAAGVWYTPTVASFFYSPTVYTPTVQGLSASGYAINNSNQVVGDRGHEFSSSSLEAALWQPDGTYVYLGSLGGSRSRAGAINSSGTIVGESTDSSGGTRAFVWIPNQPNGSTGTMVALPIFSEFPLGTYRYSAVGVNDDGVVVGNVCGSDDCTTPMYAFRWSQQGGLVLLGSDATATNPTTFKVARGINNYGQIVGRASVRNMNGAVYERAAVLTP